MVMHDTQEKNIEVEQTKETSSKKKSGWGKFLSFLIYGGWIVILIVIVGIVLGVSILTSPK